MSMPYIWPTFISNEAITTIIVVAAIMMVISFKLVSFFMDPLTSILSSLGVPTSYLIGRSDLASIINLPKETDVPPLANIVPDKTEEDDLLLTDTVAVCSSTQ